MSGKPIKIFFSSLSNRFYASQHYKIDEYKDGTAIVTITGEKFDVTDDIADIMVKYGLGFDIKFKKKEKTTK
jgi:hypothetical protein